MNKLIYLLAILGVTLQTQAAQASDDFTLIEYQKLISKKPENVTGKNVKVWNIKQNKIIRINLVEMSGELSLHKHPDAEHSLMVLEGELRANWRKINSNHKG